MSRPKEKGRKYEHELVALLNRAGYTAERVPGSGMFGPQLGEDFAGDVAMTYQGERVQIEVKYQNAPRGYKTFLDTWAQLGYAPCRLGVWTVLTLEDFLKTLSEPAPEQYEHPPQLVLPIPKRFTDWMEQAQKAGGYLVASRLPVRTYKHKWFMLIAHS